MPGGDKEAARSAEQVEKDVLPSTGNSLTRSGENAEKAPDGMTMTRSSTRSNELSSEALLAATQSVLDKTLHETEQTVLSLQPATDGEVMDLVFTNSTMGLLEKEEESIAESPSPPAERHENAEGQKAEVVTEEGTETAEVNSEIPMQVSPENDRDVQQRSDSEKETKSTEQRELDLDDVDVESNTPSRARRIGDPIDTSTPLPGKEHLEERSADRKPSRSEQITDTIQGLLSFGEDSA